MQLCEYGCGQEAKHQLKNGKWCCGETHRSCPFFIEKIRKRNLGKKRTIEFRKRKSKLMIGENNHMFGTGGYWKGKKRSENDIKKFIISHRQTIKDINEKYPFFSKIENIRYNPNKPNEKEIQGHCKNHNCKNSKEKGGWFTLTKTQLYERIRALEKPYGMIENNFYCSQKCKDECPLYNLKGDPYKNINLPYTHQQLQIYNKTVLERENGLCEYCGEKAEHTHHIRPKKLEPFFVLDPDFGVACCEKCHYKYGHQGECSTGNLAKIVCRSTTIKEKQPL